MNQMKKETEPMKSTLRVMILSALALMIAIPAAIAQTPEASILPVTEPLDVGGTILQPGTYTIRVLKSTADRNKVQVTSQDMKTVYATVLTVPHPLEPNEEVPATKLVFYPAEEGRPRALRTWFAPNPDASQGGHDIVYDEDRARQLARLTDGRVVAFQGEPAAEIETTTLQVVTPEATLEPYVPPPAPVIVETPPPPAVIETPAPAPEPMISSETEVAEAETPEMPATASNVPLIAVLGLLMIGSAFALRRFRRE
jgi:LPXTG-motif cell wall-anchored protein